MSETEHISASPGAESHSRTTPVDDPTAELQALRALVIRLQSALIALTWIVGVFIFIQFWRAQNELKLVRPQAVAMVESAKRADPVINQFLLQLVDYARTHPDVQPLLAKYPIQIQAAAGSNQPPASSAAGVPAK